jgi:hypothetical protein
MEVHLKLVHCGVRHKAKVGPTSADLLLTLFRRSCSRSIVLFELMIMVMGLEGLECKIISLSRMHARYRDGNGVLGRK